MTAYVEFLKLAAELNLVGLILNHFLLCRKSNDALKKENGIFEKFLKRLDPNDMQNRGSLSNLINSFSQSMQFIFCPCLARDSTNDNICQLLFPLCSRFRFGFIL